MNCRLSFFMLILVIPVIMVSCAGKVIRGSGAEKSEQRNLSVGAVTNLDISAPLNAQVFLDGQSSLILKGPSDALPYIKSHISGHTLYIEVPDGTDLNLSRNVEAEIHLPALKGLKASGSSKTKVVSPIKVDQFDLDLSGAVDVTIVRLEANSLMSELSGSSDLKLIGGGVEKASYDLSGSGNIDAFGMESGKAKVDISGAAEVSLSVREVLDVEVSGAGSIRYKGKPQIHQNISGAGRLIAAD